MSNPLNTSSLHFKILKDIRHKIVEGLWKPGFQLDKETALAEQYSVSRMTMNKVLTQLVKEGYIVRRKRVGSFVAQTRAQSAVFEINKISDEVAALGREYRWSLLSDETRRLGKNDFTLLDVDESETTTSALVLEGIHYGNDEPFCLEMRAINLEEVPNASDIDFSKEVPGNWLLQTKPWTTARNTVRAINVSGRDARLLDLPVGAACLEILRKTQTTEGWITHARLLYPGDAHQISSVFEPKR